MELLFAQQPEIRLMERELVKGHGSHVLLTGLYASARALALSASTRPLFVVMDNEDAARYMFSDLKSLTAGAERPLTLKDSIFFFPHSQKRRAVDEAAQIQRTECLTGLSVTGDGLREPLVIVTYPEAIAEAVPKKEDLSAISFQLKVGQEIQQTAIGSQLSELGFEHVDFVFQPGQYAIRGSIVDIYSYSHDNPYRIDFFGDEIDSIREFDIEDQLSKTMLDEANIVGPSHSDCKTANAVGSAAPVGSSIIDYLPQEAVWVSNDWKIVQFKLDGLGVLGSLGSIEERCTIELNEKSTFAT